MSALLDLLDVRAGGGDDIWVGPASGPEGKRSFGGQFMAQSLAAACRTVEAVKLPTNMHLQFLRGGEAGDPVEYSVARVFDGRTAAARRVDAEFVRRLWWRATVPLPDDPLLHTLVAAYVTDVYMIDPALQVHGFSMKGRTHRSGTTDSSIWFHRPVRADQWNLLESRSPAAARGRGVI
ncbi:MAG: acyl-CoA thioesterase, partial [Mycobacterium sp.]|nr:acyl-CoA thioesterase [Mycobacterium sp.]